MGITINNWREIYDKIDPSLQSDSYVYAALTDEVFIRNIDDSSMESLNCGKLLEIRVFNEKGEYRLIRPNIGQEFRERFANDDSMSDFDYFEQDQYLDIAEKDIKEGYKPRSINGGWYELPKSGVNVRSGLKLQIRNYVKYNETDGQARVSDWRIVKFVEG